MEAAESFLGQQRGMLAEGRAYEFGQNVLNRAKRALMRGDPALGVHLLAAGAADLLEHGDTVGGMSLIEVLKKSVG